MPFQGKSIKGIIMSITQTQCTCGTKVEIRTGPDMICSMRSDKLQAVYPDDEKKHYCIYRCKTCLKPMHETIKDYAYIPHIASDDDVNIPKSAKKRTGW
jgi:hypothetical protein